LGLTLTDLLLVCGMWVGSDPKLLAQEYQRFNRVGSMLGYYLVDHVRGRSANSKGLAAFIKAIGR